MNAASSRSSADSSGNEENKQHDRLVNSKNNVKKKQFPFRFPAFRSSDWINSSEFTHMAVPPTALRSVEFNPKSLVENPATGLFPGKVATVRGQLKRYLFRQALTKIQNVF